MPNADEDKIRERAHALWLAEGQPDNRAAEHWARAEREVGEAPADTSGRPHESGPDESADTIRDNPKSSIETLAKPAPDTARD